MPSTDPYERIRQLRAELETGYTDKPYFVGKILCPAGEQCPNGLRGIFTPLKNGRLPIHRDGTYGDPCPGSHKKPTTPPLQLRPASA